MGGFGGLWRAGARVSGMSGHDNLFENIRNLLQAAAGINNDLIAERDRLREVNEELVAALTEILAIAGQKQARPFGVEAKHFSIIEKRGRAALARAKGE